jgi:hypothetical protein
MIVLVFQWRNYLIYLPIVTRSALMTAPTVLLPVVFVLVVLKSFSYTIVCTIPFFRSALMTALAVLLPDVFVLVVLKVFSVTRVCTTLFLDLH